MSSMKVVVTGSLGNISQPLAVGLVQKGHSVTVISSKQDKQKEIETLGATAAIGSLEDLKFLLSTFTGADAVYAMVPPNLMVPDIMDYCRTIAENYKKAIQQSGVKRVVLLSSIGAELDKGTGVIVGSYHAESILSEFSSGVNLTILRPAAFFTNLNPFKNMIKNVGIMGSNYAGEDLIPLVHARDIAAVAAEEIETPSGKKVRYVVSDERTPDQIASAIGAAIGKPDLKWVFFTDAQVQKSFEDRGISSKNALEMVGIGSSIHSGLLKVDFNKQKPHVFGKVKLEEFAKEYAAAF